MDCAETLTGLKDSFDFEFSAKSAFQAAKSARATILKLIKKAKEVNTELEIKIETFNEGQGFYKEAGSGWYSITPTTGKLIDFRTWRQYPANQWEKHVYPMIKNLSTI